jgi:hypothetical protein
VTQENRPQQTFVEWVLNLLEERFPWLGKEEDAQISGADAVDELNVKGGAKVDHFGGAKGYQQRER